MFNHHDNPHNNACLCVLGSAMCPCTCFFCNEARRTQRVESSLITENPWAGAAHDGVVPLTVHGDVSITERSGPWVTVA